MSEFAAGRELEFRWLGHSKSLPLKRIGKTSFLDGSFDAILCVVRKQNNICLKIFQLKEFPDAKRVIRPVNYVGKVNGPHLPGRERPVR
jgi:hypothetical protein